MSILRKVGSLWATQPRSNSRPCSSKGGQPLCPFSSRRFYLFSIIARSPHRPPHRPPPPSPFRRTRGKGKWVVGSKLEGKKGGDRCRLRPTNCRFGRWFENVLSLAQERHVTAILRRPKLYRGNPRESDVFEDRSGDLRLTGIMHFVRSDGSDVGRGRFSLLLQRIAFKRYEQSHSILVLILVTLRIMFLF